jgi:hypothetical protein
MYLLTIYPYIGVFAVISEKVFPKVSKSLLDAELRG